MSTPIFTDLCNFTSLLYFSISLISSLFHWFILSYTCWEWFWTCSLISSAVFSLECKAVILATLFMLLSAWNWIVNNIRLFTHFSSWIVFFIRTRDFLFVQIHNIHISMEITFPGLLSPIYIIINMFVYFTCIQVIVLFISLTCSFSFLDVFLCFIIYVITAYILVVI